MRKAFTRKELSSWSQLQRRNIPVSTGGGRQLRSSSIGATRNGARHLTSAEVSSEYNAGAESGSGKRRIFVTALNNKHSPTYISFLPPFSDYATFSMQSRSISTTYPCSKWSDKNNKNDKNDRDAKDSSLGTPRTPTEDDASPPSALSAMNSNNIGTTTSKSRKPSTSVHHTAPSFRATKVFFTGELEHVNVKSTELLMSSKIHARDLFDLNLTSRQERRRRTSGKNTKKGPVRRALAAILPRKTSIVISFAQIRAVVGRHYVLFLEAHDPTVQDFAKELSETYRELANQQRFQALTTKKGTSSSGGGSSSDEKTKQTMSGGRPQQEANELLFLEEVLRNAVDSFNRRLRLYDPIVMSFLDTVANEVYSDTGVHQLVPLKDSLQSFEMHVKQCLECLTELLDDDEQMLALLLTEQAKAAETGEAVDFQRHQHVELLLGVYSRQLNNQLMEIQFLLQRIQSKQEFVALALAGYRNRMVRMNVTISIATLSLCFGTTVAGFYGMNVVNGFEDSTTAFSTIVTCSSLAGIAVGAGSMNYLSGRTMQVRASQRLGEIETLSGALSDMCALDYAVKSTLEEGKTITKDEFRIKLRKARQSGEVTDKEVDLLFHVFDSVKDGMLDKEDMDLIGLTRPSPTEVTEPTPPSSVP